MDIMKFENTICTVDPSFLKTDKYTFSLLVRILSDTCTKAMTDGERFMIFYSREPYPVWVWTPDDADEAEMETVYRLARDEFDLSNNHFNMKHSLADYFIKRGVRDARHVGIEMNMLAYSCDEAIVPKAMPEGYLEVARDEDLEEAVGMFRMFHAEIDADENMEDICRGKARRMIANEAFFFWNDGSERVACCGYNPMEEQGSLNSVYTLPNKRRHGYASALVYYVTNHILKLGKTPTLYTDADYAASNSCYTALGYKVRGELCTVG